MNRVLLVLIIGCISCALSMTVSEKKEKSEEISEARVFRDDDDSILFADDGSILLTDDDDENSPFLKFKNREQFLAWKQKQ